MVFSWDLLTPINSGSCWCQSNFSHTGDMLVSCIWSSATAPDLRSVRWLRGRLKWESLGYLLLLLVKLKHLVNAHRSPAYLNRAVMWKTGMEISLFMLFFIKSELSKVDNYIWQFINKLIFSVSVYKIKILYINSVISYILIFFVGWIQKGIFLSNQAERNYSGTAELWTKCVTVSHLLSFLLLSSLLFSSAASPSPSVCLSLCLSLFSSSLAQALRIKTPEKAWITMVKRKRWERNLLMFDS